VYCNAGSQWVPACGGGAGLDKPGVEVEAAPPTHRPTMRTTAMAPQATTSSSEEPSSRPTTSWELWISGSKNPDSDEGGSKEGGTEPNTGNTIGIGNYTPSNETDGWFNADTWGDRVEDEPEDEGVLDKIDFWNNSANAMESSRNEVIFLVSVVVAWAVSL